MQKTHIVITVATVTIAIAVTIAAVTTTITVAVATVVVIITQTALFDIGGLDLHKKKQLSLALNQNDTFKNRYTP